MTDWSLDNEDDFDFMDPNDPTTATGSAAVPADDEVPPPVDGPPEAAGELDVRHDDEGFIDTAGAVRLRVDEEHRVVEVRISNRWRERLKDALLGDVVLQVAKVAQTRLHSMPMPSSESSSAPVAGGVEDLEERADDLLDRRRKLEQRPAGEIEPTRWEGTEATGTSSNRQVTVTLDIFGDTAAVVLEEEWLAGVKAGDLAEAIVQAHQDAYTRWAPPEVHVGEFGRLAAEQLQIRDEALAMIRRDL